MPDYRTDTELLRASTRDPRAFEEFYRRNAERLYLWALKETRDADTATEVTGEAFAAAYCGLRRFRGETNGSGTAWLFSIASHLVADFFRTQKVDAAARLRLRVSTPLPTEDEASAIEARLDDERAAASLREAFSDLPPNQREALLRHVVDEESYAAIAAASHTTPANVRMRVSRALRRLAYAAPGGFDDRDR